MNEFETMQFIPADAIPAAWSIDGDSVQQAISELETNLPGTVYYLVVAQVPSLLDPDSFVAPSSVVGTLYLE
jgi:hypothetical protein